MLNKNLEIELNKQQILPILNTTELHDDIKRLEVFLSNNSNIKNIEITLRQENSFEIAKELNKNFTNINFGLGSILSEGDYLKGKDAGFHFFVSPGIVTSLVKNKIINYIPGGETISEFMYLLDNGYKNIKFFPSNVAGGQKKLVSIKNILKEASFIPTGGINQKNYMDFISLKNVLCVGMSKFDD
jgi:2-dehydro-3-deoxyphosphogluconate aldolase / (4S)-4-hydroxy-2-oxoglutarate aldolase